MGIIRVEAVYVSAYYGYCTTVIKDGKRKYIDHFKTKRKVKDYCAKTYANEKYEIVFKKLKENDCAQS